MANTKQFNDLFPPLSTVSSKKPYLEGDFYLANGELKKWTGPSMKVKSPVLSHDSDEPTVLGSYPMMDTETVLEVLDASVKAHNYGRGTWPSATPAFRISCMEKYLEGLKKKRDQIVQLLMWEICKTFTDAQKEVDRTIKYIADTIKELKTLENKESTFISDSGVFAQIRRAPIGLVLCLGPFNYPFNETYTTLIPAILMGNCVIMKLPRVGVLCHFPTFELFKDCFPPGVVGIISGSGRETMPPIMKTGKIDCFAFIGTSHAADELQKAHPKPHRLRVCLGLEAKNPAIILPDANLDVAVKETVLGSLSFNGQRCTAIKIVFVHKDVREAFLAKFVEAIDKLKMGMPWDEGTGITPLPEPEKPHFLTDLITDALSKGAKVVNPRGNKFDRTFVSPTILFPVSPSMRVYHEEQFGPVVPVREFSDLTDIFEYLDSSPYGQQASLFTRDETTAAKLIDVLVNQVSRVNINSQCQRGPDSFPFTGRKDSAYGTLSVGDALRVFSLRALVTGKEEKETQNLVTKIVSNQSSNFLRLDYLF